MSKSILLSVTIFDSETGEISKQIIKTYESSCPYGFEIERMFEKAGEQVGRLLAPDYYIEEQ